jgi:ribonuclease HII
MIVMSKLIAGIDEAGRGAVMGPLVIAGVSMDPGQENHLRKIGVKDSKLLSPARREKLSAAIEKAAKDMVVIKVGSCKIDNYRRSGVNLNQIEAMKMADIVNYLKPDRVYIDSPDTNISKFQRFLKRMIDHEHEMVMEHKADYRYPSVAAASIIAKVARDREIEELKEKHGEIGSGYTSDPVTIQWLENWISGNRKFPDFVRSSWITAGDMLRQKSQTSLMDWFRSKVGI